MKSEVVLVKAVRDIVVSHAIISRGACDPHSYPLDTFIQRGTIGIVDGVSKRGVCYRIVSFEDPYRGFATADVRVDDLATLS